MTDYALRMACSGVNVEVRLNDVPMFRTVRDDRDEDFVNQYIAGGRNSVVLTVSPPPGKYEEATTARAAAELLAVPRGTGIPDGEVLARAEWPNTDTPPRPRNFPQIVTVEVNVDAPDYRGWRNAQPLRLDDATRAQILKLLRQLTIALAGRDLNTTVSLLTAKVSERARAYGATANEKLGQLRQNYGELMARSNWGVEEWKDADAQMQLVGQSRLIRVTNAEGRPLIRSADLGGTRLVIPTDVTYVSGRWTILR